MIGVAGEIEVARDRVPSGPAVIGTLEVEAGIAEDVEVDRHSVKQTTSPWSNPTCYDGCL